MVVEQAVRASVPPSSFAALLRRSKFVTYDPRIGQIYTTHDGHAHRGDWGLKRPLAIRRRDAHIAIQTVDTLYQQTEWTSAHTDAVWLKKAEKLGVTPKLKQYSGSLYPPPWLHDPDLAQSVNDLARLEASDKNHAPEPNVQAMSEKRFARYLKRVRKIAPEFEGFLESRDARNKMAVTDVKGIFGASEQVKVDRKIAEYKSMAQRATASSQDETHHRFIAAKYMEEYKEPNSTFIRPLPHPTAGFTYVNSSPLQNIYAHKPVPGRRLLPAPSRMDQPDIQFYNTLVAGWIGTEGIKRSPLPKQTGEPRPIHEGLLKVTDFGTREGDPRTETQEGTAWFRTTDFQIVQPPSVVGRYPARLGDVESGAKLELRYIEWNSDAQKEVDNPHLAGSFEYCSYKKPIPVVQLRSKAPSMTNPSRLTRKTAQRTRVDSKVLLESLKVQVEKSNQSPHRDFLHERP